MLSKRQRITILELHRQGKGIREIARLLEISRKGTRKVIRSASDEVPLLLRSEKAEPYRQRILELYASCKGNLVRVHEELGADGLDLSYAGLTAFCRRHGIGVQPKEPAGQYHFSPGQETQHDTSPHAVPLGGKEQPAQCASGVLCYSHMLFFQYYPNFQRFHCKIFLTDAAGYYKGMTETVMIDNTHVVVLRGTGANMVPVPEMAAFAERFDFKFAAHESGDANRSARVEAPFHFIENNFLAGRKFADWDDLNRQAREWCDRVNGTYKKHIRAVPRELFAVERLHLKPLPGWIPEVYRLHERMVDVEAFVSLHSNRYSVPGDWIGRRVEVRETRDKVEIQLGLRDLVIHKRVWDATGNRYILSEHRRSRGQGIRKHGMGTEERAILELIPDIAEYVAALKQRTRKIPRLALRQLLRMAREYPRTPLLDAIREAARYGLYDLDRLERMILRRIAGDYFRLNDWGENGGEDD
jgi:transposase